MVPLLPQTHSKHTHTHVRRLSCLLIRAFLHTSLVVWNINSIFPCPGNFVIPTDELIFFRGVAKNHQPESRIWLWPLPIGQVGLLMPHFSMEKSEAITICGACSILNVFTMLFTMYLPCYICPQFWLKQVHGFFLTDRYWSNLLPRNAVQLCSSPTHDFQSATSSNQIG